MIHNHVDSFKCGDTYNLIGLLYLGGFMSTIIFYIVTYIISGIVISQWATAALVVIDLAWFILIARKGVEWCPIVFMWERTKRESISLYRTKEQYRKIEVVNPHHMIALFVSIVMFVVGLF